MKKFVVLAFLASALIWGGIKLHSRWVDSQGFWAIESSQGHWLAKPSLISYKGNVIFFVSIEDGKRHAVAAPFSKEWMPYLR